MGTGLPLLIIPPNCSLASEEIEANSHQLLSLDSTVSGATLCTFPLCVHGPLSAWHDCTANHRLALANVGQFIVHAVHLHVCSFSFVAAVCAF